MSEAFNKFIAENMQAVRAIAEANTVRNKEGLVVITKDDPWREEKEWDEMYCKLRGYDPAPN